jgi:peptidoglycan/xylan/chitin deacetylase (PgdA/CDA1 family)
VTDWYVHKGGRTLEHADWDELERARARGFEIGSHTSSHPGLRRLEAEAVREELEQSREELQKRLGRCEHFAYPYGGVSAEIAAAVQQAGYRTACTTRRGFNRAGESLFLLRRQNVSWKTGTLRFRRKVGLWW